MIRYLKLGYVALGVTDLEKSVPFYRDVVGLQLNEQADDGTAFLSCSDDHHNIILYQSDTPGLKRVGWEIEDESQFEVAIAHLKGAGLTLTDVSPDECRAGFQQRTIRFQEPTTGLCLELFCHQLKRGASYKPTVAKIARLGHVVVSFEEWATALQFFKETMNFRVSDGLDGFIAFMRCFPNPYHHTFGCGNALPRGGSNGLNHINFMVTDMDDIGSAIYRMERLGVPVVFGPGRHPPSGSIFFYFLDPDGMTVEYSFGMEEFPEVGSRKPRILEARPDSLDFWGAKPADQFASTGAILDAAPQLIGAEL